MGVVMLDEAGIKALEKTHKKVGVIDWDGHQLVFRRPSRVDTREYNRKQDSPAEKPDALDQLAQVTLVAFDGETDPIRARTLFNVFLDDYPMFCNAPRVANLMGALGGAMEAEEAKALGKGVAIWPGTHPPTQTVSPNGSKQSSTAKS